MDPNSPSNSLGNQTQTPNVANDPAIHEPQQPVEPQFPQPPVQPQQPVITQPQSVGPAGFQPESPAGAVPQTQPIGFQQPEPQPGYPVQEVQPGQAQIISENTQEPKPSGKKKLRVALVIVLLLLFLSGTGAYLIAYEKIKLDSAPKFQAAVANLVMSLPFTPKTPKYLLFKSMYAHQEATSHEFDVSVAITSSGFTELVGFANIDLETKGAVSYDDPSNLETTLNASITKDFNFDFRKKDKLIYFKINKIPTLLLSFIGIESEKFDPLLNQWVYYDTTPLQTEARKYYEENEGEESLSEKYINETLESLLDEKLLEALTVSKGEDDDAKVYKLSLVADDEIVNHLQEVIEQRASANNTSRTYSDVLGISDFRLSDIVKNLKAEVWFDRKSFYTRRITTSFDMVTDQTYLDSGSFGIPLLDSENTVNFVLLAKFVNFGKAVVVDTPPGAVTFEEYAEIATNIFQEESSSQISAARDTQRIADLERIRSALELYRADCQLYPETLEGLIQVSEGCASGDVGYMIVIPQDPTDGEYYYQRSADYLGYDLCAELEESPGGEETCPNTEYNFHIQNP